MAAGVKKFKFGGKDHSDTSKQLTDSRHQILSKRKSILQSNARFEKLQKQSTLKLRISPQNIHDGMRSLNEAKYVEQDSLDSSKVKPPYLRLNPVSPSQITEKNNNLSSNSSSRHFKTMQKQILNVLNDRKVSEALDMPIQMKSQP